MMSRYHFAGPMRLEFNRLISSGPGEPRRDVFLFVFFFVFSTIFSLFGKGNKAFMKVYQCFYWTSDPQFSLEHPAILVPI
jgi:hypothetical protein